MPIPQQHHIRTQLSEPHRAAESTCAWGLPPTHLQSTEPVSASSLALAWGCMTSMYPLFLFLPREKISLTLLFLVTYKKKKKKVLLEQFCEKSLLRNIGSWLQLPSPTNCILKHTGIVSALLNLLCNCPIAGCNTCCSGRESLCTQAATT